MIMELNNPYKMIWLIIIKKKKYTEVIEAYNQRMVYFTARNMLDTFEYKAFKQNYENFIDLLKERSEILK